MAKISAAGLTCSLWVVLSTAPADAYWPPRFSATFEGQCVRPNKQPAAVRLALSPVASSFNTLPLIEPDINGATVSFMSDGMFRGEKVRRSVVGVLQPDFSTILMKITQPDAKWADCTLQAVTGAH